MEFQHKHFKSFWFSKLAAVFLVELIMFSASRCHASPFGNETDQVSLLEFKRQIVGDLDRIFDSWNDSQHFCQWTGVKCGHRHQRVVTLNLNSLTISGPISPYIGNLSFLRNLNLNNNSFYGEIPHQIGHLFRLRKLSLGNNSITGAIPANLSHCTELTYIYLQGNNLAGNIPTELGSIAKLTALGLGYNNLTGFIPPSLGNLTSLQMLYLGPNNLEGTIPSELGKLTSLLTFTVQGNYLSGTIPPSVFNISSIIEFSVPTNQLTGTLPANIGLTLPNMQEFVLGINKFSGTIPTSLTNASQLRILEIGDNNFVGQVPANIGDLTELQYLGLNKNQLGGNATHDFSFITSLSNCSNLQELYLESNNFGGELPNSIGNLSQLQLLGLENNQISGQVPVEFENLATNLYGLGMDNNILTGEIPDFFGKFQRLSVLSLSGNQLSGSIPSALGNMTGLISLQLNDNILDGEIPSSLGKCSQLIELYLGGNRLTSFIPQEILTMPLTLRTLELSHNLVSGALPSEVGTMKNLNLLNISGNNLTGEIPETIGGCLTLEYLDMGGNLLEGVVPSSLASLRGLRYLDLSKNNLSGKIPEGLENLRFLKNLNLSYNKLEGDVPTSGVFSNMTAISVVGNSKLCGGIHVLHLPPCPIFERKNKSRHRAFKIVMIIISTAVFLSVIISICFLYRKRRERNKLSRTDSMINRLLKISYHQLYHATAGFSEDNLIGSGTFGSVYKGTLDQQENRLVAVKVFNLQRVGASKSFNAECRALRKIRHRNLVKVLSSCSSIDFGGREFKAIIYEYMENGNLDTWLHPEIAGVQSSRTLNLNQRLDILIDVASALHYLHDNSGSPIIHCDLKPSNILLDEDMTAHIGDFGLARLVPNINSIKSQELSSSIGIRGTIGYAAPEYGMGSEASVYGDVYSYGILVLEMFTGRRPTDDMFKDGVNLHKYVMTALLGDVLKIAEPKLIATEPEEDREVYIVDIVEKEENTYLKSQLYENCIASVLKIGLACSEETTPTKRMAMNEVLKELNLIKGTIHGTGVNRNRPL